MSQFIPMPVDQIDKLRNDAEREMSLHRNNPNLSDIAKQRAIAKSWVKLADGLADLKQQTSATRQTQKDQLQRKIFGLPQDANSTDIVAYRDARDRVAKVDSETAAIALLNRSRNEGDHLQVRAVLAQAYESGWAEVINAHTAAAPHETVDAEALWELSVPANRPNALVDAMYYFAPPPPEFQRTGVLNIRAVADGADVGFDGAGN